MGMGTLQSCRFISPAAPAPFAAVRPPPSTSSAFGPPGCRRWPSLKNQQRHGAIRPCLLVVLAKKHKYGGAMPASDELADGHYFVEGRKRVMDRYNDIIHTDHGCLYIEATKMSGQLCLLANQALTLASQIMSSASLNHLGAPNEISISADTIHTTLRAYAKIFVDAAHGRRVSRNTATSLLGALRGLASVSHILLDAALDALSQTHPRESLAEYALNCDVETMRCEFGRQMDDIEHGVRKTSAAETWCKVVMPGIMEATRITGSLVRLMVARRERALGKPNSKVVPV